MGLPPGKEQALFAAADKDGDDLLTIDEFLAPRAVPELLNRLPSQPQHMIPLYEPNARRIWSSFRGTVLETTWLASPLECLCNRCAPGCGAMIAST